ncbi:hypothetical protein D8Y22_13070 [Salinadaptatus halalkaliphilus]|uniref:CARDB domain-containing protein n=1 Tax=Salinadaptatus halalkaliphilus TaxID=2419781 RepID=A0A4S3TJV3_9EURY|nr:hypothetical protein D8Y22_13070 [Salinadaptatus halalkaliphilus]
MGTVGLVGAVGASTAAASPDAVSSVSSLSDDDDGESVVVRLEDDHVVTESNAGTVPESFHYVTTNESDDKLVVEDGVVETESGHDVGVVPNDSDTPNPVRTVTGDPNLVVTDGSVVNDTLVVDEDTGIVQTAEGNTTVEANGESIRYTEYDTATFDPEIVSGFEPVGEGLNLTGEVEVTNRDWASADKNVTLEIVDDAEADPLDTVVENVSLDRGESTTQTFDYGTVAGDYSADEISVWAVGDHHQDNRPITIHQAETAIEIVEADPRAEGDELEIDVEIDRFGDYPRGQQDFVVEFRVGPESGETEHVESKSITLDPGGEAVETFVYETEEGDSPSVYVEVLTIEGDTPAESDSETVPVIGERLHEQRLETTINDRNWPDEGEELVIEGLLEYTEPELLSQNGREYDVDMFVDGDLEDTRAMRVDPDEPFDTADFVYQTDSDDPPRVDVRLESPGDADTAQPRINGSGFLVDLQEVSTPVNESETLTAIASIRNTGDTFDEQDVRLRIDNGITAANRTSRNVEDNATVALDTGEGTTERFTYETDGDDVPEIEVAVVSEDDEDTAIATVRDSAPRFEVQETNTEYDDAAETVTLSAAINNTGTEPDEQYVEFLLDDDAEPVHVDRVALEPWESRTLTSTIDAPDDGAYDFSVVTDNVSEREPSALTVDRTGDDPDEPPSDDDTEPEDDDPSDATEDPDDGLPWYLVVLGMLGVLASVLVLLVYRNDPENFPPDASTLSTQARRAAERAKLKAATLAAAIRSGDPDAIVAALKGLIGLGTGVLVVQNELPRETIVRVRCQTADDTVVLEDLELAPDERRDLGSLPDADQFKVGAGVEDITAHEEVFQGITGDVGVVLRAEGILIANLN